LKSAVVSGEMFDDDQTLWDRAKSVQVLILDDLGKGVQDRTGFGMRVLDELIRHRNANQRVTFVTTNIPIRALHEELKESTMHSLKECIYPVKIDGEDMRDDARDEIGEMLS
jgi:DNA replication protein DnaC